MLEAVSVADVEPPKTSFGDNKYNLSVVVTFELDELLDQERETRYCIETDYNTYKSEAETIIKILLWDLKNKDYDCVKDIEKAEKFIKE